MADKLHLRMGDGVHRPAYDHRRTYQRQQERTAVTRALLQEDRTARLRSRKAWLWGIPLLLSVWFLVRLLLSYCFGSIFTYAIFEGKRLAPVNPSLERQGGKQPHEIGR